MLRAFYHQYTKTRKEIELGTLIFKKEYDLRREEENFLLLRAFYHQYTKTRREIELGTLIIKKDYDLRREEENLRTVKSSKSSQEQ